MNRMDFIKGLVGSSIFGWIGLNGKDQIHKAKVANVIYQSYVRGLVHSPCHAQLSSVQQNEILQIVREHLRGNK